MRFLYQCKYSKSKQTEEGFGMERDFFSFSTVVEMDIKLTIFSSSYLKSLCEDHSYKTGSIGGCLIDIFVVCAHCMKGLITLVKIGCF